MYKRQAAYNLGQLVAVGALDQDRAVEALTAAAESAGLVTGEIDATIESGLTAGAQRPRALASTSSDVLDTRESRADDPTQPSTDRRPQDDSDATEDQHRESPRSIGAEPLDSEHPPATEPSDLNASSAKESDGSVHVRGPSAGGPISDVTIDDSGADLAEQVAPGSADPGERADVDRTSLDWTDDVPSARETAADALWEAAHTVAEARNSGTGSVAGKEVDQLTNAAYAALEAWTEPPSEPSAEAGASEPSSDERRPVEPRQGESRPAAIPEEPADEHAGLDKAIEHARAAVTHLEASRAATRCQSGADSPDAAIQTGRPAHWPEPEVDL